MDLKYGGTNISDVNGYCIQDRSYPFQDNNYTFQWNTNSDVFNNVSSTVSAFIYNTDLINQTTGLLDTGANYFNLHYKYVATAHIGENIENGSQTLGENLYNPIGVGLGGGPNGLPVYTMISEGCPIWLGLSGHLGIQSLMSINLTENYINNTSNNTANYCAPIATLASIYCVTR